MSRQRQRSSFRPSAAAKAACGEHGFVPLTFELLNSDVWCNLSIHAFRVLTFLMREHLTHGGKENGFLAAPYDQLMQCGISRYLVRPALDELVASRLVEVTHRGLGWTGGKPDRSMYRLTFLQWKLNGATGPQWIPPTNEWKACGVRKPAPQIKQQLNRYKTMKPTKQEQERNRYLIVNTPTFGTEDAAKRWDAYEELILTKYGEAGCEPEPSREERLNVAWRNRDRKHA